MRVLPGNRHERTVKTTENISYEKKIIINKEKEKHDDGRPSILQRTYDDRYSVRAISILYHVNQRSYYEKKKMIIRKNIILRL